MLLGDAWQAAIAGLKKNVVISLFFPIEYY